MANLEGPRRDAASGTASSLVILLHGYGADGNDLIGIADAIRDQMPNTVFRSPNAPEPCSMNPMGRQWFPISFIDGSSEAEMMAGAAKAQETLQTYLDQAMAEEGMTPDQTLLVGFSQGTMMSLAVAPRRAAPLAGVVGFSGRLNSPEKLAEETVSRPPVLLIHGDMDDVVPAIEMQKAQTALEAAGFDVQSHLSRGIGHGIAPDGLGLALQFMQARLT